MLYSIVDVFSTFFVSMPAKHQLSYVCRHSVVVVIRTNNNNKCIQIECKSCTHLFIIGVPPRIECAGRCVVFSAYKSRWLDKKKKKIMTPSVVAKRRFEHAWFSGFFPETLARLASFFYACKHKKSMAYRLCRLGVRLKRYVQTTDEANTNGPEK